MALVPFNRNWLYEPWEDLDQFFHEWPKMKKADFIPAVNVYEKKDKVIVEAAITGIDPQKVDVSVEDNQLILKGQAQKESEVEEKDYYCHEVKSGSFYRAINLPARVKENQAQAEYQDGILKVEIPKEKEKEKKKVKVKIKPKKNNK